MADNCLLVCLGCILRILIVAKWWEIMNSTEVKYLFISTLEFIPIKRGGNISIVFYVERREVYC